MEAALVMISLNRVGQEFSCANRCCPRSRSELCFFRGLVFSTATAAVPSSRPRVPQYFNGDSITFLCSFHDLAGKTGNAAVVHPRGIDRADQVLDI